MHFSIILPFASLAAVAMAQESESFSIVLRADDDFIDGRQLTACSNEDGSTYYLCDVDNASTFITNTTEGGEDPIEGYEPLTTLVFEGHESKNAMRFELNPSSNLATCVFEPQAPSPKQKLQLAVERDTEEFAILSYWDDTKNPPVLREKPKAYKNWWECGEGDKPDNTATIKWVLGDEDAEPQTPGCHKVQLVRDFEII